MALEADNRMKTHNTTCRFAYIRVTIGVFPAEAVVVAATMDVDDATATAATMLMVESFLSLGMLFDSGSPPLEAD